jgi:hypothetical protein
MGKKSVKNKRPNLAQEAKEADNAYENTELSRPIALLPFYTKEGLVLVALAIILVAISNTYTRYLGWACLLAAFIVPLIRQMLKGK